MSDTTNPNGAPYRFLAGGRHPVNVGHLVMGLAFLGLVGIWSLIVNDVVDDDQIRFLLPLPWVLAGLGGLAALAIGSTRKYSTKATGWVEPTQDGSSDDTTVLATDESDESEQADRS